MGVAAVARGTRISTSTCFNILRTLTRARFVSFHQVAKTYTLGLAMAELAAGRALPRARQRRLRAHDQHVGPGRQHRAGQLLGGQLGITALSKSIALDMQRFGVRSNCIAPFAWSRMTSSIPAETPEQKARVAKLEQMTPDKNAPLAVFLASDAAKDVTGQVFAARHNEIFLMSQSRPLRSVHRGEGWTPALVAEQALPALRQSLLPLDRSADVFGWDPV